MRESVTLLDYVDTQKARAPVFEGIVQARA